MFLNPWIVSVLAHLHNKLNTEKSIKIFYIPLIKRTLKLQLFRLRDASIIGKVEIYLACAFVKILHFETN